MSHMTCQHCFRLQAELDTQQQEIERMERVNAMLTERLKTAVKTTAVQTIELEIDRVILASKDEEYRRAAATRKELAHAREELMKNRQEYQKYVEETEIKEKRLRRGVAELKVSEVERKRKIQELEEENAHLRLTKKKADEESLAVSSTTRPHEHQTAPERVESGTRSVEQQEPPQNVRLLPIPGWKGGRHNRNLQRRDSFEYENDIPARQEDHNGKTITTPKGIVLREVPVMNFGNKSNITKHQASTPRTSKGMPPVSETKSTITAKDLVKDMMDLRSSSPEPEEG